MYNKKEITKISKFLSLVLRHKPQSIGITLDENGWTDVPDLIRKSRNSGINLDLETLKHVVSTNSKKRFLLDEATLKIRANQGHSVTVDLGYTPQKPPDHLFHGTGIKSVESILASGIDKKERIHVHLSPDITTAINVGKRHGQPAVFRVNTGEMFKSSKFLFYLSDNGVWLTDNVPRDYLQLLSIDNL